MNRSPANRLFAILVSAFAGFSMLAVSAVEAAQAPKSASAAKPKLVHPMKSDVSRPLRHAHVSARPNAGAGRTAPPHGRAFPHTGARVVDPVVQKQPLVNQPTPDLNFVGSTAVDDNDQLGFAVAPSDSAGDVGGGHFVQLTNSVMQVW